MPRPEMCGKCRKPKYKGCGIHGKIGSCVFGDPVTHPAEPDRSAEQKQLAVFENRQKSRAWMDRANGQNHVLFFYLPGCGHCIRFMPSILQSVPVIEGRGVSCIFVNGDSDTELSTRYNVLGFPTVLYVSAAAAAASASSPSLLSTAASSASSATTATAKMAALAAPSPSIKFQAERDSKTLCAWTRLCSATDAELISLTSVSLTPAEKKQFLDTVRDATFCNNPVSYMEKWGLARGTAQEIRVDAVAGFKAGDGAMAQVRRMWARLIETCDAGGDAKTRMCGATDAALLARTTERMNDAERKQFLDTIRDALFCKDPDGYIQKWKSARGDTEELLMSPLAGFKAGDVAMDQVTRVWGRFSSKTN
jgi:thiol-disulfide isomerase/thioredoxin